MAKGGAIVKSLGSIENALNCLLDNFVIVSKSEFNGISGYFCKECLSFQYRYITNIWDEKTQVEYVHICNMTSDVNRGKEIELRILANRELIELTNSLFGGHKKFMNFGEILSRISRTCKKIRFS